MAFRLDILAAIWNWIPGDTRNNRPTFTLERRMPLRKNIRRYRQRAL